MNLITPWIRSFLPALPVSDRQLAEDLTLRGIAVEGEFPFADGNGTRFEMDITTNRVDAMNHYGVAREAAAIYNVALTPLTASLAAPVKETREGAGYPVRIEAEDLCGRFTTRILRGVTVKPATGMIAGYFAALGQKPISGPVDVTNFGWLAMGQPTHVFDLDKVEGAIVVRRAMAGEKLRLLDGTEKTLVADDLVVADEKKALGLAGVMGGWESRVTEETKNILVEAAWFDPASIRASSRRHGLHTDASHRFERGADFNAAPVANALITRLVLEQAGGEVEGPLVDVIVPALAAKTAERKPIQLRVSEVQRHLGTTLDGSELSAELITQYLSALGCELTPNGAPGDFLARLPSWRLDLEREIDLIEEVARVYGYNRFADTLPTFSGEVIDLPHAEQERVIRTTLRALGFSETISSTFVSAEAAAIFAATPAVPMGNPLSEEAGVLRPALAANMASALALNLNRDVDTVRLFELGTAFTGSTAEVTERQSLALGLTGNALATALYTAADALFYEAKGALEAVLAKFNGAVSFSADNLPTWIEAGRGANVLIDGKLAGSFGELSSTELQRRKLKQTCVLAELDAQTLLETTLRQPVIRELSRFQSVARDFSFLFPDSVQWSAIDTAIRGLAIPVLTSVSAVEIFRDPKGRAVAAGSYSLLVRTTLQSPERTLTDEEITSSTERITAALTSLGGSQRA
ncbi:MAG: phenylalanine--tRNA ligase subunit beta [Acidobacteriaceae bacterium]|nr:phenylalanine--tRNA ligase subunit beta [Acidobacteriaceae bacterium]